MNTHICPANNITCPRCGHVVHGLCVQRADDVLWRCMTVTGRAAGGRQTLNCRTWLLVMAAGRGMASVQALTDEQYSEHRLDQRRRERVRRPVPRPVIPITPEQIEQLRVRYGTHVAIAELPMLLAGLSCADE